MSLSIYQTAAKIDPSKTLTLRNRFAGDMRKRFNWLTQVITESIVTNDCFGLKKEKTTSLFTNAQYNPMKPAGYKAFDFNTSGEKVMYFQQWLKAQADLGILEITEGTALPNANQAWTSKYIQTAYQKGIQFGDTNLKKKGYNMPSPMPHVSTTFNQPFHLDKVGLIYTRTFSDLKGVTAAMDTQISRVLAQGLADGKSPTVLARQLVATINGKGMGDLAIKDTLGRFIPARRRAELIARTEVIRAHHVASINEYRAYGVHGIFVQAEWNTAKDNRVCPRCHALEGTIWSLDDIENKIPLHPQCRCVALPQEYQEKAPTIPEPKTVTPTPTTIPRNTPRTTPDAPELPVEPTWTKVGPRQGSVEGGLYELGEDKEKYYVKFYKDEQQARQEYLSNRMYKQYQLNVPEPKLVYIPNEAGEMQLAYATKWNPNLKKLDLTSINKLTITQKKELARYHAVSGVVENWDVVGLDYDNLLFDTVKKRVVLIDAGGSFRFRAMGGSKPFSKTLDSFDTLLSSQYNPQASNVFNPIMELYTKPNARKMFNWARDYKPSKTTLTKLFDDAGIVMNYDNSIMFNNILNRVKLLQKQYQLMELMAAPTIVEGTSTGINFKKKEYAEAYTRYKDSYVQQMQQFKQEFKEFAQANMTTSRLETVDSAILSREARQFLRNQQNRFAEQYRAISAWQGSTYKERAMAFKVKAARIEVTNPVLTRAGKGIDAEGMAELERYMLSDEDYLQFRAFNQAYMEVAEINTVTLHRGTGGSYGSMISKAISDAVGGTSNAHREFMCSDSAIAGYTTSSSTASSFGYGDSGYTVRTKFKREELLVWQDLMGGITDEYLGEKESIAIGIRKVLSTKDIVYYNRSRGGKSGYGVYKQI